MGMVTLGCEDWLNAGSVQRKLVIWLPNGPDLSGDPNAHAPDEPFDCSKTLAEQREDVASSENGA